MEQYDVVIVGCGPAGLTAALFASRAGLKTVVVGQLEKSQLYLAMDIQNYFGFPEGIDGPVLLHKGMLHAQKFGAAFINEEAVSAEASDDCRSFSVKTAAGRMLQSRAMIIATGVPIRLSGVANEAKLTGKGVHYCVNCDGAFYQGKKIAIIGNGNHAAESALEAISYSKDITILANATTFDFSEVLDQEITKWNIKTRLGKLKEFAGEKWLEGIVTQDGQTLTFDGVFMACGVAGALDFASNLGVEIKENLLVVDENNMTSMPGVFAAGNCAGRCRQIARNVGDGCNAAINVIKYLNSRDVYMDYVHTRKDAAGESPGSGSAQSTTGAPNTQPPIASSAPMATAAALIMPISPQKPKLARKLRIGWFSFSCCEDSTIVFTELLNDHFGEWKDMFDFAHVRVLKNNNDLTNLDIAFVEGAISSEKMMDELKEIRANCKKLVAIGSCAATGMPSGHRNEFDEHRQREIDPIVQAYSYRKNVVPLHDLVQVDATVPGCPMTEQAFLKAVDALVGEFASTENLIQ